MLVLDSRSVRELLPWREVVDLMRSALASVATGEAFQPPRTTMRPPELPGVLGIKPAVLLGERPAFGLKIVTHYPGNPATGLAAVQGAVLLLDPGTGTPVALVDAASVTELRTAATSALATDLLAPAGAGDLAVIGAGVQAKAHIEALATVRDLRRVRIWNRTPEHAHRLAAWAAGRGAAASVADDVRSALAGADLVCTTVPDLDPPLPADAVEAGAHVNAIGAFTPTTRELSSALIARSTLFVDTREGAVTEAGDVVLAVQEGAIDADHVVAELGDVVLGKHPGRTRDDEVTVFKSLGLAVEDVVTAAAAVERAGPGVGVRVEPT